jgi:hypothetical protein
VEEMRCLGEAVGGSGEGGFDANETVSLATQRVDATNQLFRGERMLAREFANLLVPRLELVNIVNPFHAEEVSAEVVRNAVKLRGECIEAEEIGAERLVNRRHFAEDLAALAEQVGG